jgi:hypothetical protein
MATTSACGLRLDKGLKYLVEITLRARRCDLNLQPERRGNSLRVPRARLAGRIVRMQEKGDPRGLWNQLKPFG